MTAYPDAAPPMSPTMKSPIGVAAFIVGAVIPLFDFITTIAMTQLGTDVISVYAVVGAVRGVVAALLGITAVVLGIVGLVLPGRPRGFAAAGTAFGASAILGVVSTLLAGALFSL
jgi:hypothetical protein